MSQRSLTTAISAVLLVLGLGACATPVAGTASPAPGAGGSQTSEDDSGSGGDEATTPTIPIPDPTTPTADGGGSGGGDAKSPEAVPGYCDLVDVAEIEAAVGSPSVTDPSDYTTICSYSIDLDGTSLNYLGFGATYWGEDVTSEEEEPTEILGRPGYRLVTEGRCEVGVVVNEDPSVLLNTIYVDLDTWGTVERDLCPEAEAMLQLVYDAVPAA
ncbi:MULTISPECIES: hypothetical protein [Actinoalloteichus]|nr:MULTISPECIES: hypothetical protein [Actinoalloteichus]